MFETDLFLQSKKRRGDEERKEEEKRGKGQRDDSLG